MLESAIYGIIKIVEVLTTKEFDEWYESLEYGNKVQLDARITKIKESGHLGDWKYLDNGIAELRWKNGRRVYFAKVGKKNYLIA